MISFTHDFSMVGFVFTVEVVYQPPVPHADNPCDLAGYCEANVLSIVDVVSDTPLTKAQVEQIVERSPNLMQRLHGMIETFAKEKIDGRQTVSKICGVQTIDRL